MTKTLVCSVPPLDFSRPPIGGALMCGICKNLNHDVEAIDLQIELNKFLKLKNLPITFFDDVFYNEDGGLEITPLIQDFSKEQSIVLNEFIDIQIKDISKKHYDYILLGLFSYLGQRFTTKFVSKLRNQTSAKIIIGGVGVTSLSIDQTSSKFGQILKESNLIDCYIVGEAEEALPMYFTKGSGPGINNNNFVQLDNLDQYPVCDYSFYKFSDYPSDVELTIIGSRGCVRSCTFCDIAKTYPKYRYRSGQNVADEIIKHYENYGIKRFYFADSLINGSEKMLYDMCQTLIDYDFHDPISWSAQYIIKNRKSVKKEHFDMLKKAGCSRLFVGIESGSDKVRAEVGKNFTNDDIDFYLENFSSVGIEILFLFFSGYISETLDDHYETLKMFKRWQKYVADGTIFAIETLNILTVFPGSPLEKIARNSNFHFLQNNNGTVNELFWLNPNNPSLDFNERVRRHLEMMKEAIKYKWPLWNGDLTLDIYYQSLLQYNELSKNKVIPIAPLEVLNEIKSK